MEFNERLIKLMDAKKVKNVDLMRQCEVTSGAVSQWRKGHTRPSDYHCLAKALDIDVEELKGYLLDGDNPDFDYKNDTVVVDTVNKWISIFQNRVPKFLTTTSNVNESIFKARKLLEDAEFNVTPFVIGKKRRLVLLNHNLWSIPSFNIYLERQDTTFVIDVYPIRRLGIIPVEPCNKFQEILYVKETEVDNIVSTVENHIHKWFND